MGQTDPPCQYGLWFFVLINWLNICFLDIYFDAQILTDLFSGAPGIYLLGYFDKFLHPLSAYFLSPSTKPLHKTVCPEIRAPVCLW